MFDMSGIRISYHLFNTCGTRLVDILHVLCCNAFPNIYEMFINVSGIYVTDIDINRALFQYEDGFPAMGIYIRKMWR